MRNVVLEGLVNSMLNFDLISLFLFPCCGLYLLLVNALGLNIRFNKKILQVCHTDNTSDCSEQGSIGVSRVDFYYSKCNPDLQDTCLICS